jgi:phosphomannomutase
VVDAANGMAGMTVPAVLGTASDLEKLPLEIIPMYFELDGSFPNHEANPLDPKNLVDLQRAVLEHGADLGLAFDGDADRCFVVDEKGNAVTPSAVSAVVAIREIARAKKVMDVSEIKVLFNLISSRAVSEWIESTGATAIRTQVGHSLIKDKMAETGAIFGGEHSAHYYFKDFYGADNGMLAAMHLLAELGQQELPLSEFAKKYDPYFSSGEINSTVSDASGATEAIRVIFQEQADMDELDGLTISSKQDHSPWWWLNLRSSNTEPLLRLNVESEDEAKCQEITALALEVIRKY